MIPPGAWLGLLGGGQLGRMFTMAAQSMGYKVLVLDPSRDGPAGSVADEHIVAQYLEPKALETLAARCAAATTEFENVPAQALQFLSQHCIVSPSADSVAVAQDRIEEKRFLVGIGLEVAPFRTVHTAEDLDESIRDLLPGILKRSRLGYDGKGQVRVGTAEEAQRAFVGLGGQPCVLEKLLSLDLEVSVIVARGFDGKALTWPVAENRHANGILDVSIIPSRVQSTLADRARAAAISVVEHLNYRGVLCVEFFVLRDGRLLANEIAPRPHNSGHYTIDACVTSQFEQQARVLCGLPLGAADLHGPAVMVNLLGELWAGGEPRWEHVLRHDHAKLHLYGKSEARPGRKMGHYTVLGDDVDETLATAMEIKMLLTADAQSRRLRSA
ncbi:MAG: 5-(carboxyamino)imidazole ribonucleotide synthase [Proteobacteria bacterium]|nr:MAG: 5-(carboxyamino)imidazole ribonucleotide synthase [Pseudomonadota bacterium]